MKFSTLSMILATCLYFSCTVNGQEAKTNEMNNQSELPYYYNIPDSPENYTATNVAARVLDGLGYRYFWATEGLTEKDLEFKPNEEARTVDETTKHIYGLVKVALNAIKQVPNVRPSTPEELDYAERRQKTLETIRMASDLLKQSDEAQMAEFNMVFQRGENKSEWPFWNLLNGPIADAIFHCGQIVNHRRTSGNPLSSKVSFLSGKTRE